MIPLFESVVWSSIKLWTKSTDTDVRAFCVDPDRLWIFPSNKYERRPNHPEYDYDWWEVWYALRQIIRWDNSSPLLHSCLYSTEFKLMTDLGQELIDNKHKLVSDKLISWTVKFCDRKIKQSYRSNNKYHDWKYVYYAISDMLEQMEILSKWGIEYPLKWSDIELCKWLKISNKRLNIWYRRYEEIKEEFMKIKVDKTLDIERLKDRCKRCYLYYAK